MDHRPSLELREFFIGSHSPPSGRLFGLSVGGGRAGGVAEDAAVVDAEDGLKDRNGDQRGE